MKGMVIALGEKLKGVNARIYGAQNLTNLGGL